MQTNENHLPSLALLRSFECAARHQNFTLAAQELHMTQSAVSRKIKELEDSIGIALFLRLGRRVTLTQAGKVFAEDIAVDLERIRQTTYRAISAGSHGKVLRIATLPTFAARWLIPRLPIFEAAHPDVEVNLATRISPFDLVDECFDLAIHYGVQDWPNTDLTELCREEMVPVAAPDYMKGHVIEAPAELLKFRLLHLESRPTAWADWFDMQGMPSPSLLPGKRFDQFTMVIAGARASLGIGLLPKYLIEEELHSGQLIQISQSTLKTNNAYYIVRSSGVRSAHVDSFLGWIRNQISTHE